MRVRVDGCVKTLQLLSLCYGLLFNLTFVIFVIPTFIHLYSRPPYAFKAKFDKI